jgi:hypothetical protein
MTDKSAGEALLFAKQQTDENIVDLALQVYARSCMYDTKHQHDAAMIYRAEILRRLALRASPQPAEPAAPTDEDRTYSLEMNYQRFGNQPRFMYAYQIKAPIRSSAEYQMFQEMAGDTPDLVISDSERVDLKGEVKRFYACPPATFSAPEPAAPIDVETIIRDCEIFDGWLSGSALKANMRRRYSDFGLPTAAPIPVDELADKIMDDHVRGLELEAAPVAAESEKCTDCNGEGNRFMAGRNAHPSNLYTCETCNGSGRARTAHPEPAAAEPVAFRYRFNDQDEWSSWAGLSLAAAEHQRAMLQGWLIEYAVPSASAPSQPARVTELLVEALKDARRFIHHNEVVGTSEAVFAPRTAKLIDAALAAAEGK